MSLNENIKAKDVLNYILYKSKTSDEGDYVCPFCGLCYINKKSLEIHLITDIDIYIKTQRIDNPEKMLFW